jgi:hypothetical protein
MSSSMHIDDYIAAADTGPMHKTLDNNLSAGDGSLHLSQDDPAGQMWTMHPTIYINNNSKKRNLKHKSLFSQVDKATQNTSSYKSYNTALD